MLPRASHPESMHYFVDGDGGDSSVHVSKDLAKNAGESSSLSHDNSHIRGRRSLGRGYSDREVACLQAIQPLVSEILQYSDGHRLFPAKNWRIVLSYSLWVKYCLQFAAGRAVEEASLEFLCLFPTKKIWKNWWKSFSEFLNTYKQWQVRHGRGRLGRVHKNFTDSTRPPEPL